MTCPFFDAFTRLPPEMHHDDREKITERIVP